MWLNLSNHWASRHRSRPAWSPTGEWLVLLALVCAIQHSGNGTFAMYVLPVFIRVRFKSQTRTGFTWPIVLTNDGRTTLHWKMKMSVTKWTVTSNVRELPCQIVYLNGASFASSFLGKLARNFGEHQWDGYPMLPTGYVSTDVDVYRSSINRRKDLHTVIVYETALLAFKPLRND